MNVIVSLMFEVSNAIFFPCVLIKTFSGCLIAFYLTVTLDPTFGKRVFIIFARIYINLIRVKGNKNSDSMNSYKTNRYVTPDHLCIRHVTGYEYIIQNEQKGQWSLRHLRH